MIKMADGKVLETGSATKTSLPSHKRTHDGPMQQGTLLGGPMAHAMSLVDSHTNLREQ